MRALMLSRLGDLHERSITLVEPRYDETQVPQRLVAGHTTHHGHTGT